MKIKKHSVKILSHLGNVVGEFEKNRANGKFK